MNPYPNQEDPNQANQYPPNQGGQYSGGGSYQTPPNVPPGYGEQPPYQQQGFQQPSYQAPYQQPPYQQSPYPPQSTLALDWRYLTAGIGALVSLIAFFIPSYNVLVVAAPVFSSLGLPTSYTPTTGGYPAVSGAQLGRQLWLDLIIVLVAIGIVLMLQFGNQMFKAPTSPGMQKLVNSLNTSPRTLGLALLAVGVFGIFFHFILDIGVLGYWTFGAWLYLLGIIAVAVGGFFIYRPLTPAPAQVPPVR
jgi:hypothetical protein